MGERPSSRAQEIVPSMTQHGDKVPSVWRELSGGFRVSEFPRYFRLKRQTCNYVGAGIGSFFCDVSFFGSLCFGLPSLPSSPPHHPTCPPSIHPTLLSFTLDLPPSSFQLSLACDHTTQHHTQLPSARQQSHSRTKRRGLTQR